MKREKLLRSKDYITSTLQLNLLNLIGEYKSKQKLKDYQLAEELGVSKGYVSQLLNATFDHKISKVVDLALACNKMPLMFFVDLEEFIKNDSEDKVYGIFPVVRVKAINPDEEIPSMDTAKVIQMTGANFKSNNQAKSYQLYRDEMASIPKEKIS
jgi:transcriptional regulator with XRE-family HTH domain